ncbi:MAG: CDGSH iron-sulfur domain-containing protein [Vampirovibrionales bacterium]|nr:CDGSH iron-sulfur domain-containing protein [Vampirovibrionales bacterium]
MESEKTTLKLLPNGPILVSGGFELLGADGAPVALDKPTVALCRCGASARNPFCDGAHARVGFKG